MPCGIRMGFCVSMLFPFQEYHYSCKVSNRVLYSFIYSSKTVRGLCVHRPLPRRITERAEVSTSFALTEICSRKCFNRDMLAQESDLHLRIENAWVAAARAACFHVSGKPAKEDWGVFAGDG